MNRKPVHIAMYSGGASSAFVAYHMVKQYGRENCILLFTDTLWEDEDNYRFMEDTAEYIGVPLTYVVDGRTPEDIFFETKYLGNARLARCSVELKVRQTLMFLEKLRTEQNLEPILYFGIGPHETHRAYNLRDFYADMPLEPVECRFPLIETFTEEPDVRRIITEEWGIRLPRMYDLGFTHANCGGRCVRGGFAHYAQLYKTWPERYALQEEMEEKFRNQQKKNVSILKRGSHPYTLKQLREHFETDPDYLEKLLSMNINMDKEDLQGAPCFICDIEKD
ncbi:hypothetical protein [Faecalibaculum rodentium]|uniref:hypothetical protein n=1 Tax=Faecalibaculum rodentium TaxID=1702221 RepID=UPI00258374DD|nr:hypothetical protein [Faecalibaculum rodentium]